MSTVLWANVLASGVVVSDEADHVALYEHAAKLDAIGRSLGMRSFLEICDTTDQRVNMGDLALPAGMTSTNELMATQGSWMPLADALALLEGIRDHVTAHDTRFGVLRNQQAKVLAELDEVIAFARSSRADAFNFGVVT